MRAGCSGLHGLWQSSCAKSGWVVGCTHPQVAGALGWSGDENLWNCEMLRTNWNELHMSFLKCSGLWLVLKRDPAKGTEVCMGIGSKPPNFMRHRLVTDDCNKDDTYQISWLGLSPCNIMCLIEGHTDLLVCSQQGQLFCASIDVRDQIWWDIKTARSHQGSAPLVPGECSCKAGLMSDNLKMKCGTNLNQRSHTKTQGELHIEKDVGQDECDRAILLCI